MASKQYNYIIAGAGCAGLSLLMRMMEDPFFIDKKILVIDREHKNKNDRTWCFWEKENGIFESIVNHQWQQVHFYSDNISKKFSLYPYRYKMIKGIDFYHYVLQKAKSFSNIEFRYEEIVSIHSTKLKALVELKNESLEAEYIFNSILFANKSVAQSNNIYQLIQHFKGWVIETKTECFDPSSATLMDFRTSQERGTCFFYIMPSSSTTALVEYTIFSEQLLAEVEYETALRNYIAATLGIHEFTILHEEFAKIPMTNLKFPLQAQRIIQMGVAGGQVKGSSGYAFQFIQKRTAAIIEGIKKGETNFAKKSWNNRKGNLYDAVLLNVLHHQKMEGAAIFSSIFSRNNIQTVLRFLDNESTLLEDLNIMRSVPTGIFLPAAMQELVLG